MFARSITAALAATAAALLVAAAPATQPVLDESKPIFPGEPEVRPFWNDNAKRFIYAPAFEMPAVAGASKYRFTIDASDGQPHVFEAEHPYAPLSPVWTEVPEGACTLAVDGLDGNAKIVGHSGERLFYKSPGFSGEAKPPLKPYADAGRDALKAIFRAPHVQRWMIDGKPDQTYALYCYPPKVMGALVRAMVAYSKVATDDGDRKKAIEIGQRAADYLISISRPADAPFPNVPPTYELNVDKPVPAAKNRAGKWLFVPAAVDAALGYLDLYDATKNAKYLDAAKAVADSLRKTQGEDGTWPVMVDFTTGAPMHPNRQNATWIIAFFDRLAKQYKIVDYQPNRDRAWQYIVEHPLKTYRWEGQFEDGTPRDPYRNLAREQACDVAVFLLDDAQQQYPENVAAAEELIRFSEDQFVIWSPIKDPAGWEKVMPERRKNVGAWITPCTLEQYGAYAPVARSSAIVINTYLKAYAVTKNETYLNRAKALANGLVDAQAWLAKNYDGNGEIPTWLTGKDPHNWLNNSFYAAEALRALGDVIASEHR